jgi:outer membrane protein assembly factor BamA
MIAMLALAAMLQVETIGEVRVHGNATLSDATVLQLAGVTAGQPLEAGGVEAIEKRLRDSGRFDSVEVRKRYRTLAMDEVSLVLVVHERPGLSPTGEPPGVARRLRNRLMFFPILHYDDGYGWTYGARTSVVDIAGRGTRLSVPLSWGGTREATLEIDRTFKKGPLTRLLASGGISQRENPHYSIDDQRTEVQGRAERRLFDRVTLGGEIGRTHISFSPVHENFWTTGADVTLDTRRDPAYPSDAVLTSATWSRLNPIGGTSFGVSAIDRYRLDARGYKRLFGQTVLAARVGYDTASAPLPPYEQWLLGGATLRGTSAGTFAGDKRFVWAAEVRVPFSSPLSTGRTGFNVFIDGGTTAPYGESVFDQPRHKSVGGGLWLTVAILSLNLDVARSLDGHQTRVHFGTGFSF